MTGGTESRSRSHSRKKQTSAAAGCNDGLPDGLLVGVDGLECGVGVFFEFVEDGDLEGLFDIVGEGEIEGAHDSSYSLYLSLLLVFE